MTAPSRFEPVGAAGAGKRGAREREARGRDVRGRPLTVFRDPIAGDASPWAGLVEDLGRILRLAPAEAPVDMQGPDWVSRLLRAAVAAPGPVLVLPRTAPTDFEAMPESHLLRVVIASGDARDVVRSARFLSRHLRAGGVHTTVVVVLSDGAVPAMWEGPGHNAAAWREELGRQHGGPDELKVLGAPAGAGPALSRFGDDADLLILMWRRVAAEGRALVVRAVLSEGATVPCLLVPLAWVERLRDSAVGPPAEGAKVAG